AGPDRTGTVGETVVFDGSASADPEGHALTYSWNFGDGSPMASGVAAAHLYESPGRYTVSLTVSDGVLSATSSAAVTVSSVDPGAPGAFRDAFERSDSPSLGAEWTTVLGQTGVQGQRVATGAVAGDNLAVMPGLRGSAQEASALFWSPDNNFGPALRARPEISGRAELLPDVPA